MQSDTDQLCWDLRGPFPMSFANSPKRTCRPLAMTSPPYLAFRAGNQSRNISLSAPNFTTAASHLNGRRACNVSWLSLERFRETCQARKCLIFGAPEEIRTPDPQIRSLVRG